MTNADRVLLTLRLMGPLTDGELVREAGVRPHQQVNQICRKLAAAGVLRRVQVTGGNIVNIVAQSAATEPQQVPRDAPGVARSTSSAAALRALDKQPAVNTLFVIPCSGRKAAGGMRGGNGPSVLELLPLTLRDGLRQARARLMQIAAVDESRLLPARQRYIGTLYTSASKAFDTTRANVVILSGGYGLLTPDELIGNYDRRFTVRDWPSGLLEQCLVAIAAARGASAVTGFCARTTSYAELLRRVPWKESGTAARLLAPVMGTRGGAQVLVPRAAGEAFAAATAGTLGASWTSSDGVALSTEVLS